MKDCNIPFTLIEKAALLYLVLDTQGTVTETNPHTAELFGPDIIGKSLENLFHPEALKRFDKAMSGRSTEPFLLNFSDKNRNPHSVHIHVGLKGYGWRVAGFPDISGLNATQETVMQLNHELSVSQRELQKSNAKLERHLSTLNSFLGMAVHDMRNPLNIIRIYTDLLKEMALSEDETSRELLTGINNAIIFMDGLITDFLSTSILQAGKLSLNPSRCELGQLVNHSIKFNQFYADKKGVVLVVQDNGKSGQIMLDVQKIQQVLNNLISNAIQHAPRGSQVTLQVSNTGNTRHVAVRNMGVPLKKSETRTLFLPYVQGVSKEKLRGAGLGLAIAKMITDMHGGQLDACNEGKEVIFRLSLPG